VDRDDVVASLAELRVDHAAEVPRIAGGAHERDAAGGEEVPDSWIHGNFIYLFRDTTETHPD
jgi:hypothetical protein